MPEVEIIMDIDGSNIITADDLAKGQTKEAEMTHVVFIPGGMQGGAHSVALVGTLKGGKKVFMETSLKLFQMVAAASHGKFGNCTGQMKVESIDADGHVRVVPDDSDPDADAN